MSEPACGPTTARIVAAARELRRSATQAELLIWEQLRNRRLAGLKFRRQHPYQAYVLDFFCVHERLAIELDGGSHDRPGRAALDEARQGFLESEGIRVLRFRNDEITGDLPGVLTRILTAAEAPPAAGDAK